MAMRPSSAMAMTPCPNLYLRHLPPNYLETELQGLLEQHTREGAVCRLTVWKDHHSRVSKGFGMAEFETTEMATRAFKALQGVELIRGKPLEIEYHHKKRKDNGSPDFGAPCTNLYVRGLPLAMTEDQLREFLRRYGEIKRLTIWKDQWGHSKGFGMCEYLTADQARTALLNLRQVRTFDNETPLHVEVNPPKPPKRQMGPGPVAAQPFRGAMNHFAPNAAGLPGVAQLQPQPGQQQGPIANLFIKGIPLTYEERDLQELVQPYGQVMRATVWRDRDTGSSKGFGLVEFANATQATNAMNALHRFAVDGSVTPLHVEYNHPRSRPAKAQQPLAQPGAAGTCSNICLKSLPLNFTDADLIQLLSQYGRIVRSTVWKDQQTNQSRGMAFCEFASPVSAAAAIQRLNGATLQGQTTPINVELHMKGSQLQPAAPLQQAGTYGLPATLKAPQPQFPARPLSLPIAQQPAMPNKVPAPLQQMPPNPLFPYQSMASPSVVIKGLPKHYTDSDFKGMLEQHGVLIRSFVDETKGVKMGVAQFDTALSAGAAINALNNVTLPGSASPLQLEFYHSSPAIPVHQIAHSQRPFTP